MCIRDRESPKNLFVLREFLIPGATPVSYTHLLQCSQLYHFINSRIQTVGILTACRCEVGPVSYTHLLQLNRKLNNEGRNITFRGSFGYGDDASDQYAQSVSYTHLSVSFIKMKSFFF